MSITPDKFDAMRSEAVILPRSRRADPEMDITPMIDITFLLLIFFIVAARIDTSTAVKLPPAKHGQLISAKNSVILTVARDGNKVWVYAGDGIPSAESINSSNRFSLDQEQEISNYINAGLHGYPPFKFPMQNVLIKAERNLKQRDVDQVLKAAGKTSDGDPIDIPQLHVAVLEEQ